ncbi:hypothetical protein BH11BAC4_BH11BAC4_10220 [soil metagenome]
MKITDKASLDAAILDLEKKRWIEEDELITQFRLTKESLSPLNLIKSGFSRLGEMPDLGQGIIKTIAGMGIGILSKKLFLGKSSSLVKKVLAGVFEFAVAKGTVNNADKIKAYGLSLYHNLFKKNAKHKQDVSAD